MNRRPKKTRFLSVALSCTLSFSSACKEIVNVGDPLPTPPTAAPNGGEEPSVLPAPAPLPATYTWQWINPTGTGVHFRALWVLPSGEKWLVGDQGTVARQIGDDVTVVRTGDLDEQLSAVWASGPNDVWIGGKAGAKGLLLHWNGTKWSEAYSAASRPVRAIHGLEGGDIFVVIGGTAARMHRQGVIVAYCKKLKAVRDLWVQSPSEVWFVGDDGIAKEAATSCDKISDTPSFAVWGDGRDRIVVAQSSGTALVERSGERWKPLANVARPLYAQDAVGKALAADAQARFYLLAQSESESGYVVFDPTAGPLAAHSLIAQPEGERLTGLAATARGVSFVGERGLRGDFSGSKPVSSGASYRGDLMQAVPARDGTLFAIGGPRFTYGEVNRWERSSWIQLPTLGDFQANGGAASSKDSLWLGGDAGWQDPGGLLLPATFEWDRSSWRRRTDARSRLLPLLAFAPDDVWAWSEHATMHYDGRVWGEHLPDGPAPRGIRAADGLDANDVWFLDAVEGLYRWNGTRLLHVAPLPPNHGAYAHPHAIAAANDGVWVAARADERGSIHQLPYSRILHFTGTEWKIIELPGIDPEALASGPDGNVRFLGRATQSGYPLTDASVPRSIYRVDDDGITKEIELPIGVALNDLVHAGPYVYAVGMSGATLRLERAPTPPSKTR